MSRHLLTLLIFLFYLVSYAQKYEPIPTKTKVVSETFYGEYVVEDPYRWMEDIHNTQMGEWLREQEKMARPYLSRVVTKTGSERAIDKYSTTRYKNPTKSGDYFFTYAYYNAGGNMSMGDFVSSTNDNSDYVVPALFYRSTLEGRAEIIVDPNYISTKDLITLRSYNVSADSKYLVYQYSTNGSDWTEIRVVRLDFGDHLDDHLVGVKHSNIVWKDDGFYYSTYPRKDQFDKTLGQQVFYHKLGTDQSDDDLVFKRRNPAISFSYTTTSDERFFVLTEENEAHGVYNIFYIDLESEKPSLKPLLMNFDYEIDVIDSHEGKFIASTAFEANNGRIIEIDPQNPMEWREISPNYDGALLLAAYPFKDRIVAEYETEQHPILTIMDYNGEILYTLELPVASSIGKLSGNWDEDEVLFSFTSYTIPPVVYKFNIRSFYKEVIQQTAVTFDFDKIAYTEAECFTKDSVAIPLIIVHNTDMELSGNNPTILKAYGGFGSVEQPSFNPGIVHFIMDGGVFVFAKIRGGGAKGLEWFEAGKGDKKQNSFSDFIAAAEYLIDERYTNPDKLAATGGSNGGLVVAAAAMQRPELFKTVVPVVAPLDMIRFEKFTVGSQHMDEYGTVSDSLSFVNLLSYSPYHNIKEDVNYPAMLVITAENDDRVPPFHSYKFVARMQNREAQTNPIILKVEKDAGHYGASTWGTRLKALTDIYGFIMYELMKKK